MLWKSLKPSRLGGEIWLKGTIHLLQNQLLLFCSISQQTKATPTFREVVLLICEGHPSAIYMFRVSSSLRFITFLVTQFQIINIWTVELLKHFCITLFVLLLLSSAFDVFSFIYLITHFHFWVQRQISNFFYFHSIFLYSLFEFFLESWLLYSNITWFFILKVVVIILCF